MENLELYEKVRAVPETAQKKIKGGRLNGMTDISPMWRIKTLTEQFGICGIGWRTEIVKEWLDNGANGEITANVQINLYVRVNGEWSNAICGVGGSKLVSKETSGMYTDDECYKKAYTDAISVACKALGFGADIYWEKDRTKYEPVQPVKKPTDKQIDTLVDLGGNLEIIATYLKTTVDDLTYDDVQSVIERKKKALKESNND